MGSLNRRTCIRQTSLPVLAVALLLSWSLLGCKPEVRERPYGYIRLGSIKDYLDPITELPKDWLIMRNDAGGLSVMSTLCSRDLYPLKIKDPASKDLICDECGSVFAYDGALKTGPAVRGLPYYKLQQDSAVFNTPKDQLFVIIGEEVAKSWRLKADLSQVAQPDTSDTKDKGP